MNKVIIAGIVIVILGLISFLAIGFVNNTNSNDEISLNLSEQSLTSVLTMDDYIQNLSNTHPVKVESTKFFDLYLTHSDMSSVVQNNVISPSDGIRIVLNESNSEEFFNDLKPNNNSVVIFPVFTTAAYMTGGFYDYYGNYCDESCITNLSFENLIFNHGGSGSSAQILYHAGYDFLTDVQVDRNPDILQNYDTVILLHNEYVTKKEFDAISTHPNLIFLFPNALYAEIDVNYDDNTMTLIRGHNYPEPEIANGFDYAIEEKFHKYEYDAECLNWEFIEIENGFHLNCYPDGLVIDDITILKKLKELT
tara:strand:- start:324 stop:1247 length:924 start_codon:yes stop_codon:yes gene_type:complete